MESLITITCPSCSHIVEIQATSLPDAESITVKCPGCGASLEADLARADFACPSCGKPVDASDVLCINCGTNLRTGANVAEDSPPTGFTVQPPSGSRRTPFIIAAVALTVLAALALFFTRTGNRTPPSDHAATPTALPAAPASNSPAIRVPTTTMPPHRAPIANPGPVAPVSHEPESPLWGQVSGSLQSAQVLPNITQAMEQVRAALVTIGSTNNSIALRLAAAYTLGQQAVGHPATETALAYLRSNFPDAEELRSLVPTNYTEACTVCRGSGDIRTGCLACGESGRCRLCASQPKGTECRACGGTGKCVNCTGTGAFVNSCSTCRGSGGIRSAPRAQAAFRLALRSCSRSVVNMRAQHTLPPLTTSGTETGWAPFLALYATPDTTTTASEPPTPPPPATQGGVCLFDAVVEFCRRYDADLAVDPETVENMKGCVLDTETFVSMTNVAAVTRRIEMNGMVLRQAPMHAGRTVRFITTQSTWAYSLGCWYIQNNQADKALQVLESVPAEQAASAQHARALAAVLKTIAEDSRTLNETARTVREALSDYAAARREVEAFATGARSLRRSDRPDEKENAAVLRFQKAEANLRNVSPLVDRFMGRIDHSLSTIVERFVQAETCTLRSESLFLLDYALISFNSLKTLVAEIERAGLNAGQLKNESVPDDIRDLRGQIADVVKCATSLTGPPSATESSSLSKLLIRYRKAFALDRAGLYARVGTGYYTLRHHTRNIDSILYETRPDGGGLRALKEEFEHSHKSSYVAACAAIGGESGPSAVEPPGGAGSRTATGLAVVLEEGEALRLSVHFRPTVARLPPSTASRGYWSAYNQALMREMTSVPVTFGDCGKKDLFMQLSAVQVYKWLAYTYPREMAGQGMHVEFHDLLLSKAGDSAGVTMGIAGYAALRQTEVRRDVAFTGSIRADGSVHAVGAVPAKVAGTLQVEGIELVIVPKENEPDLLLVPLDQLCRIAIVTSDNMQTYVKHATGEGYRHDVLEDVRRAQILLLTGRRNECRTILEPIARKHPDMYTARRLLEIIAFHEQTSSLANTAATGKTP